MRSFLVVALALASLACAEEVDEAAFGNTAYGYLKRFGIPEAKRIREAEEKEESTRIVGGSTASLGQYPYQAGLIIDITGLSGSGVCGGSVLTNNRVITAAHCWSDGQNQAWRFTVVLGSVRLYSGGTRQQSTNVVVHPQWFPLLVRNDVAVIKLPNSVSFTANIAPISLPTGAELNENFAGVTAVASGFGITRDGGGIGNNQALSHVRLNVITNSDCTRAFNSLLIQSSTLCTSGAGGVSTCGGDSGGPLVITRGNRNVLIGVTSFGSAAGCQVGSPAAFARVTSFVDFFRQHM